MKLKLAAVMIMGASLFSNAALAHPGSKILTLGGNAERSAMTPGVSFEEKNGVHLFRGGQAPSSMALRLRGAHQRREIRLEIHKRKAIFRTIRTLRTQGFYSGAGPESRRYTQGFYSGD